MYHECRVLAEGIAYLEAEFQEARKGRDGEDASEAIWSSAVSDSHSHT